MSLETDFWFLSKLGLVDINHFVKFWFDVILICSDLLIYILISEWPALREDYNEISWNF